MSEVTLQLEDQPDPPLIAFSYAFQRMEIDTQPQQIPLLVSANISRTELPDSSSQHTWHVAATGTVSPKLLSMLRDAIALSDIDLCQRRILTPCGQDLNEFFRDPPSEAVNDDPSELQDRFGWSLPLLHQLSALKSKTPEADTGTSSEDLNHSNKSPDVDSASVNTSTLPDHHSDDQFDMINQITEDQLNPSQAHLPKSSDRSHKSLPDQGHLILLVSNALESVSPRVKSHDLSVFSSITMIMSCSPDRVLSWHRWNTSLGGTMLRLNPRTHIRLADRLQRGSCGLRRVKVSIGMTAGFSITGVTQLTTQLGPLPVEGREHGGADQLELWAELPLTKERWSALLMIKYKGQRLSDVKFKHHTVATLSVDHFSAPIDLKVNVPPTEEIRHQRNRTQSAHVGNPLGGVLTANYDQLMIGVAFAQQLSHRVRVIDNLILSLLRRDPRKPGKLLDQLVKITATLEPPEYAEVFRGLKLEFLALGELPPSRWEVVIAALLRSTHRLSSEGQWLPNIHSEGLRS